MNKRPTEQELKKFYNRYKKYWIKTHSGDEYKGMEPACFEEWLDNEYRNRFYPMVSPNCKQVFVYDAVFDVYIDPPMNVLISLTDWRDGSEKYIDEMETICSNDPDWLYDREYWYKDLD